MAAIVYMTASDMPEAERISTMLIEQRLAACTNILGDVRSMFWWDGGAQSENEVAFIAKTSDDTLQALIEAVKTAHSYDVPCIVALPVTAGNPEFLSWIEEETSKEP